MPHGLWPHQGDIGGGLHSSRALHPAGGAQ